MSPDTCHGSGGPCGRLGAWARRHWPGRWRAGTRSGRGRGRCAVPGGPGSGTRLRGHAAPATRRRDRSRAGTAPLRAAGKRQDGAAGAHRRSRQGSGAASRGSSTRSAPRRGAVDSFAAATRPPHGRPPDRSPVGTSRRHRRKGGAERRGVRSVRGMDPGRFRPACRPAGRSPHRGACGWPQLFRRGPEGQPRPACPSS